MTAILHRCVYCRNTFPRKRLTRDRVIAGSWYPRSTPSKVQRITALSCADCNVSRYSAAEGYLLLRLSACVDPQLPAANGIWEQARQAMDVTLATDERERACRQAAWDAFNQDTAEIDTPPAQGLLPAFASNFDIGSRTLVRIQADRLDSVAEKWALGIHSHVWKEPAAADAEMAVLHISEADAQDIFRGTEGHWKTIDRGPGISVLYLADREGTETLYEFKIWGQVMAHVSIRERDKCGIKGHSAP
jgi:hypothetical protein